MSGKRLPRLDIQTRVNHSPHVVVLGAGASRACCKEGDKNRVRLPLMADFIELVGIETIIKKAGCSPEENFEKIYSEIHKKGAKQILNELDVAVRNYFGSLVLPDQPTLYDYLVLSLRPKDMIVTFNWDPLLNQAFKRWRHLGKVLPEIIFLHGNVDLGIDVENKSYGFLSDQPKLTPTDLLYPVENKNYQANPFLEEQWRLATDYLGEAYYVTIFGYSAPKTDVEARSLLLNAWRRNPTRTLAQFSIVDIRNKNEVEASWTDFLDGVHGGASSNILKSYLMRHPRRTCEAFAFATLQQTPWHEDRFPNAGSLQELEDWVKPLIEEEAKAELSGEPHH